MVTSLWESFVVFGLFNSINIESFGGTAFRDTLSMRTKSNDTKIENSIKSCSSNFNSKTGGAFMKRILVVMLLACVVLLLTSCFDFGPLPDMENGVVKLKIRNPNYGINTMAIPTETDSFVVLVKGFPNNTPVVFKDSFGNKEYIEFSIKLPGERAYSFYLIGRVGERITCFGSIENVLVPSGEKTQLETQMKPINFSYERTSSEATIHTFKEPFDLDSPREVKWAREEYVFTYTGSGLGDFFNEVTRWDPDVFTGYEFDIWNGDQYHLYGHNKTWYIFTGVYTFSIGEKMIKFNENTIRTKIPIFFPLLYSDDGSDYEYEWGEFTFSVPVNLGNERVIFKEVLLFSELSGDVQIIIE